MMRIRIAVTALAFVFLFSLPSEAAGEHVRKDYLDRQTFLNKTSDFMATVGKTDDEKEKIKRKRRAQRRRARLEAENARVQRERGGAFEN